MKPMKVMEKRCNQCLYGHNKIVSNARRKQILADLEQRDDWFICHKATIAGVKIGCRGDWDARRCGRLGRMADTSTLFSSSRSLKMGNKYGPRPNGVKLNDWREQCAARETAERQPTKRTLKTRRTTNQRTADVIDGYNRDDLGESHD